MRIVTNGTWMMMSARAGAASAMRAARAARPEANKRRMTSLLLRGRITHAKIGYAQVNVLSGDKEC
jgi:hypothetical protein